MPWQGSAPPSGHYAYPAPPSPGYGAPPGYPHAAPPAQGYYPPPPGYGYAQGPQGPPGYWYPPPPASSRGRPFTIAGLVCGIIALVLFPIILGPLGAVFGFIGNSKGDRLGLWVGIGSIFAAIAGLVLAFILLEAARTNGFMLL